MMDVGSSCGCNQTFIGPSLADTCSGTSFVLFMGMLNTLVTNQCSVSDICRRVTPMSELDDAYDFVVIGGGSGGSVAAGRLAEEKSWKVLLLEAGSDEPPGARIPSMTGKYIFTDLDWKYYTQPEPVACQGSKGRKCFWPRGKALGGTGVHHGMMYMRGSPSDFDAWAELGNEGWSYKDVLPEFLKPEDNLEVGTLVDEEYHGKGGPLTVSRFAHQPAAAFDILEAGKELGYPVRDDLTGKDAHGFTIAQAVVRDSARLTSARAYVLPQRNNPNFHVSLNSTATKIILSNDGYSKKVTAVQFVRDGETYTVNVRKEVIVSAGAVGSPHLLLVSGIGPKEDLEKVGVKVVHDLPGVGKNLMNHVSFTLTYYSRKEKAFNPTTSTAVNDYVSQGKGPLSSTGLSQVTARINSKYGKESDPDLQFYFRGYSAGCSSTGQENEMLPQDNPGRSFGISPTVVKTKSRGYLTLNSSNPLDYPVIYANYLTEKEDLDRLIDGVRIAQKIANTSVMKEKYDLMFNETYGNCSQEFTFDSDEFWACAIKYKTSPENHQSSSCMMGPKTNPLAVVDNKLVVHGIENLRVMDASVMPFMVSSNPYATIVMISERGVGYVNEKWLE